MANKTVFYASVGPELFLYDLDMTAPALHKRAAVALPVNVQYAWAHPAKNILYVVSSNGGPGGLSGDTHLAGAFRIDPASGALAPHGAPRKLPSRPIHVSVNASGDYLLTAYNSPSNVTVHRIARDGGLDEPVRQSAVLDTGIYGHQIRTTPSNRTAILVARDNNAADGRPEEPGALKVFGFEAGVLSNMASIAPGSGIGFGPRHLDFHPTRPWVYVSIERQNKLCVYELQSDGGIGGAPMYVRETLADPENVKPGQGAGPIHVDPDGGCVYLTNRNAGLVDFNGRKVSGGGEGNIAVFAIDRTSGEPRLVQIVDAPGNHLRTFAIDPGGRLLIAASIAPLPVRDGGDVSTLPAALLIYWIGADGRLDLAREYPVETGEHMQFWSGLVTLR